MKKISNKNIYVKNPETGDYESIVGFQGESAYDAAVRLGLTTLTQEQWLTEYIVKRDEAIEAIEASAENAIDDIEQKGADTLASIPEDYTTLTSEVSQLSEEIDNILSGGDVINETPLTFEAGTIHGQSYGNHAATLDTGFSLVKITPELYDTLEFDATTYKFAFVGYLEDGTYQAVGGWHQTSPVVIASAMVSGDFNCIQFRRIDGQDLVADDLTSTGAVLAKKTSNDLVYKDDFAPVKNAVQENQSAINGKTSFSDFSAHGIELVLDQWRRGTIRGNFPNWTDSTTKMTTENPIRVNPGMVAKVESGYSFLIIRSTGAASRYNANVVINYTDDIWIEANKIDDSEIFVDERPVTLSVEWKPNVTAYVDGVNGNDSNPGTMEAPYKTIMAAVNAEREKIYVAAGTYTEMVDLRNRYYPIAIKLWEMPVYDGSVAEAPKIIIDGGGTRLYGILVENNAEITLSDVHCKSTVNAPLYFKNCQFIDCVRCIASDTTGETMGFQITNANGRFVDCLAYNIGKDGFNIHGYGDTEFLDCVAHDCGDDGISHHDGCTGRIVGGEFYNCVKGGVASPTYGAYVDVSGVYSHDNTFGIYTVSEDTSRRITKMRISDCALKNNGSADLYLRTATAVMWNTVYDTKTVDDASTLTEIN